jgi:hypothetical protein
MQEDKASKRFASMLRKQQEENPLPYELGAWEAFSQRRSAIARKKTTKWISGLAASLALLLVVGGVWLTKDSDSNALPADQLASEEKINSSQSPTSEVEVSDLSESDFLEKSGKEKPEINGTKEEMARIPDSSANPKSVEGKRGPLLAAEAKVSKPKKESPLEKTGEAEKTGLKTALEGPKTTENLAKPTVLQSMIASGENVKTEKEVGNTAALEEKGVLRESLPKDPQLSPEEIEEILKSPSFARLALGLSPGFGSAQGGTNATTGSSLGFGVMIDKTIAGKIALGSGLAVNYLSQASESQNYIMGANFASPVTATSEIAQVQVDIPLYVSYPVNPSQSISVQAGFSNLITFNQNAEQNSTYTRQISVLDASSAVSNSFTVRSESVSQTADLDVPENRFYPFATANLGVIFRLFESKKTSYEVMPFYNYPLQDFSGYGEKLGIVGASFKVNFGSIQRK